MSESATSEAIAFVPPVDFDQLRQQRPVCRLQYPDGHVGWLVTTHALARVVLTDRRFSRRSTPLERFPTDGMEKLARAFSHGDAKPWTPGLLDVDPPEHKRIRRVIAGRFSVREISALRPGVERIVAARLDAMEASGSPVDLVETFALPVAAAAQCLALGIPENDWSSIALIRSNTAGLVSDDALDNLASVGQAFDDYVGSWMDDKQRDPGDDMVSDIVRSDLSETEKRDLISFLFGAGLGNTAEMLALGTFVLFGHPEELQRLLTDPAGFPRTVEELLRFLTMAQVLVRTALEDVELDGNMIKAGDSVWASVPAANRDPAKFEHPDTFDPSRSEKGHLAFGQGVHMCVGQHLARLALVSGLSGLFERFPTLRLAIPAEEVRTYTGELLEYGVHELPVSW